MCLCLTLRFFIKFVSRTFSSNIHQPTKWPRKQKHVALEKFKERTTLKSCLFWAGEALEAQRRDCLNITSTHKWHSIIFQISAEQSFQAWKKVPAQFYTILGVAIWKIMWQDHYIYSISAENPFYQAWKFFSAEIWKMLECHFLANVMLRQSRLWATRASPAQKWQGLRVFFSKNFSRATFFVFWVT